ncbi:HNH endonuclease signature motif containing protein [Rathayibacter festucae]|uniref:HNH endonuclease n=1 Tax=Rathayibacter festucae DSM 15932 TaxID=1328866 RepID=A0A3Q9UW72_9MICO|nr:HNH endonuclease signature motif containing protein [Rathayibacter festucae]AZZ50611.1 HNH endonuclease [Rathayibacter festucae DSM 15932]
MVQNEDGERSREGRAGANAALASAVDAVCAADPLRARAEAQRAELVERARLAATASYEVLVDPLVRSRAERREAAERALVAELATALRMSEAYVTGLIEESRLLVNELPQTLAALREGRISPEHARVILRAAVELPPEVRGRLDEEAAVVAADRTPPQLQRRLRTLRERLHPESTTERHRRCAARRAVWLDGGSDGMATLLLHLPAPQAQGAFDRIDRAARSLRELPGEKRTIGQLRADVGAALLIDGETDGAERRSTGTAVPVGIRPRVAVTVPVLTLLGRSDEPGTLDGYGPIDPETARRLAADAPSFTRILTHPETGAVLSVGRTSYRVPADLRRHLLHRDETCRFPGCTRAASAGDVDHGVEWQHGGRTDADNLAHLCRHHHRLRHTSTWQVEHRAAGVLHWTSPTGRRHVTHPARIGPPRGRAAPDREPGAVKDEPPPF